MDDNLIRTLTAVEFDVLWERLRLGPTPVALQVDSPGRTHLERTVIVSAALRGLRGRGLVVADGPEPELARLLALLARPSSQFELRGWSGHSVRAVTAEHREAAVVAVRHGTTVELRRCGSMAVTVTGLLPDVPAGPGQAATVPSGALDEALAVGGRLRDGLLTRGIRSGEAGLISRMLDGIGGRCQIVALAADRWGVARRHPDVVTVLDTERGRYLLTRTRAADGSSWATVAPTDLRRLRGRLTDLVGAATDAAAAAA